MAEQPIPPYPKNAPGDFYVQNGYCLKCEAPYYEAPDLMAHDSEGDNPHCYFKKQPETPVEVERAVMACYVSCIRVVRYAGKNPKILKRFLELGSVDSCDVFSPEEAKALPPTLRQMNGESVWWAWPNTLRDEVTTLYRPVGQREWGR